MSETKPVYTPKYGPVEAAVWENSGKNGVFYRVSFKRSYKDDDGWHDSESFGLFDLWNLVRCVGDAYVWISKKTSTDAEERQAA